MLRREVEMAGTVRPTSASTCLNASRRGCDKSATRSQQSVGSSSVKPASVMSDSVAAQSSGDWSWTEPPSGRILTYWIIAAAIGQFSRVRAAGRVKPPVGRWVMACSRLSQTSQAAKEPFCVSFVLQPTLVNPPISVQFKYNVIAYGFRYEMFP
jgi:hypothetical protein